MQEDTEGTTRLGRFLRERRESQGWKLEAVARQAELNHSYLSKLETGRRGVEGGRLPRATVEKLARGYQVSIEALLSLIEGEAPRQPPVVSHEDVLEHLRMVSPIAVPVVEHPAHAGHAGSAMLDYIYLERSFAVERNLVCVPVVGDCMAPRIEPQDKVIVDREISPSPGRVIVAYIGEELVIRRYFLSNSHIILRADNLDYPDIQTEEADIVGVVVEIRKRP